jgi:pyrroloquinoline quinone biosynthesis protein B
MRGCLILLFFLFILTACRPVEANEALKKSGLPADSVSVVVLGTLQDGGWPHAGCKKPCCDSLFRTDKTGGMVVSLGLCDAHNKSYYMVEAGPDWSRQVRHLQEMLPFAAAVQPAGIFLTHAHIGHYSGLMQLGKEVMNSAQVPVYAMPRMMAFLNSNGPWDQLVKLNNIRLQALQADSEVTLSSSLRMVPFQVPHRDEYSETVGYRIVGPSKTLLFIPDIDKWEKWTRSIQDEIRSVDYALIDATFYDAVEINHRNPAEIPHPFVIESMALFDTLPLTEKNKIYFIHTNHTNPLLRKTSKATKTVEEKGFHVAETDMIFKL